LTTCANRLNLLAQARLWRIETTAMIDNLGHRIDSVIPNLLPLID
jgi:hypothetical protein